MEKTSRNSLILGIDVGTSGTKIGVFDANNECLGLTSQPHETRYTPDGGAEQTPSDWWEGIKRGLRYLSQSTGIDLKRVEVIGVDCMTPCLIPVDSKGEALSPAHIWADKRCVDECRWIENLIGNDTIREVTGNSIKTGYLLPKIVWFKKHRKALYDKTDKFLQVSGYITMILTGRPTMDRSQSELTLMADKQTGQWSRAVLEHVGVGVNKLPPVFESSEIVGAVTRACSQETGLPEGAKVIAGGHDSGFSAFAMGVRKEGQLVLDIGTAGNLGMCVSEPKSLHIGDLYHHVHGPNWILQAYSSSIGLSVHWFVDELCTLRGRERGNMDHEGVIDKMFEDMNDAAAGIPPGAQGILYYPYLTGLVTKKDAKAAFLNLSAGACRDAMYRAVLEGCAFEINRLFQFIQTVCDRNDSEIRVTGGGARSSLWCQIFADVMNRRVLRMPKNRGAVSGVALVAGSAAGILDLDRYFVNQDKEVAFFEPTPGNVSLYAEAFRSYIAGWERLFGQC